MDAVQEINTGVKWRWTNLETLTDILFSSLTSITAHFVPWVPEIQQCETSSWEVQMLLICSDLELYILYFTDLIEILKMSEELKLLLIIKTLGLHQDV